MCQNIVEGRLYEACGHFHAMNTERSDCQKESCVFSKCHPAGCVCKNRPSHSCNKFMATPENRPIRQSPRDCPDCVQRHRMGGIAVGPSYR